MQEKQNIFRHTEKSKSQGTYNNGEDDECDGRVKSASTQDCKLLFDYYIHKLSPQQLQQAQSDDVPEYDSILENNTTSTDYLKTPISCQSQMRYLAIPKQMEFAVQFNKNQKLTDKDLFQPIDEQDKEQIKLSFNKHIKLEQVKMKNGGSYTGHWFNGKPHGHGVYIFGNGSLYSGDWINGNASGKGEYDDAEGGIYIGDFKDYYFQGKGIYKYNDGTSYEGNWYQDKYHGVGVEKKKDSIYQGKFAFGKKEGIGMMLFNNNEKYDGHFSNDYFDGQGTYTWADGRQYNGSWKKSMMHGFGVLTYPDGRCYAGSYFKDKRHGKGTFQYADGRKYVGHWENGVQHGKGEFFDEMGKVTKGQWREGKLVRID